ncbi:hypothetical protein B566_EDAN000989 [Ephemera danica]|nr:hypothetical protein B566_EDAN000989 [Ephemera danica]
MNKERRNLLIDKSPSSTSPLYSPTRAALISKPVTPNQNNVHRKLDFQNDEFREKENSPDKFFPMNNYCTPKKSYSSFTPKRPFLSNPEGNKDDENKVKQEVYEIGCEKMREDEQKHLLMYLPIVESSYGNISTQSLMEQFLGTHQIKCFYCEEEEGACQAKLVTLPRVLILALKRYDNCGNKLLTPVTISPYLDLDKFVADKCESPKPFE